MNEQKSQKDQKRGPRTQLFASTKNPPYVNMSDEQRAECKRVFLETLGQCWIIAMSCKAAGISRPLYDYWRKTDYVTQDEIDEARREWEDVLRGELVKVGIVGVPTPLIHNGRIALEPDGRKAFINKRDNRVLTDLASRYLPEWADYKDRNITVSTTNADNGTIEGVPREYALVLDLRALTPTQFATIKAICIDLDEKERAMAATVVVESDGRMK